MPARFPLCLALLLPLLLLLGGFRQGANAEQTAHPSALTLSPSSGKATTCEPCILHGAIAPSEHHGSTGSASWTVTGAAGSGYEVIILNFAENRAEVWVIALRNVRHKKAKIQIHVSVPWTCWEVPPCNSTNPFEATAIVDTEADESEAEDSHESGCTSCDSGPPLPGAGSVKNNGVDFRLYLGNAERNSLGEYEDAGYISLHPQPAEDPSARSSLRLPLSRTGVQRFPASESQPIAQVKMPQGLVIAADTTGGFSMSVYDNDQVVQQPDGSFLPIQNGHPFAIWTVTRVGGDPNIIQVQETAGKTFFYTNSSGTGWKQCGLRNPDGSYSINRVLATIS